MKQRIYIDTSVIGGYFDEEFKEATIKLFERLENNEIIFVLDINEFELYGYENEFLQALINILNNSKDALENKENPKLIFISTYKNENIATIKITDNGGGIDEKIIEKICEPYFTTKHQSKGTGIGLYMTEEIIVKHMKGELLIKNIELIYENRTYDGTEIIIKLKNN